MFSKVSANTSLAPGLPPLTDLRPAQADGVDKFNAVLGNPGERQEVSDAELQKAIGNSIMTKLINDSFEQMRERERSIK